MTLKIERLLPAERRDMSRASIENHSRMEREAKICRRIVRDALAAGYSVSVNDGDETTLVRSTSRSTICEAMWTTDEDWLFFHRADQTKIASWDDTGTKDCAGWVRLIYGNDCDLISDYSSNSATEALIEPCMNYAETLNR